METHAFPMQNDALESTRRPLAAAARTTCVNETTLAAAQPTVTSVMLPTFAHRWPRSTCDYAQLGSTVALYASSPIKSSIYTSSTLPAGVRVVYTRPLVSTGSGSSAEQSPASISIYQCDNGINVYTRPMTSPNKQTRFQNPDMEKQIINEDDRTDCQTVVSHRSGVSQHSRAGVANYEMDAEYVRAVYGAKMRRAEKEEELAIEMAKNICDAKRASMKSFEPALSLSDTPRDDTRSEAIPLLSVAREEATACRNLPTMRDKSGVCDGALACGETDPLLDAVREQDTARQDKSGGYRRAEGEETPFGRNMLAPSQTKPDENHPVTKRMRRGGEFLRINVNEDEDGRISYDSARPFEYTSNIPTESRAYPQEQQPPALKYGGEGGAVNRSHIFMDPTMQLADAIKKISRPPAPLPVFSGNAREFLAFRASYRDTTTAHRYSAAENMNRLRNALRGEARETVAARLYTIGDPEAILTMLERRFGDPEAIIAAELRRVRDCPRLGDGRDELKTFACQVDNCVATIKALGQPEYLHNQELGLCIWNKLTPFIKESYNEYRAGRTYSSTGVPELERLSEFLNARADKVPPFGFNAPPIAAPSGPSNRPHRPNRAPACTRPAPIRAFSRAYTTVTRTKDQNCAHCRKNHLLVQCDAFAALDMEGRWSAVKKAKVCFKCLKGNHRSSTCKARPCGVNGCHRRHNRLLHQSTHFNRNQITQLRPKANEEENTTAVGCTTTSAKRAFLKIAPVTLRGPCGTYDTFALLDDGSTVSLLESIAADRIGADGPATPFRVQGIGGLVNTTPRSRYVNVEITARGSDDWQSLDGARTVDTIGLGTQSIEEAVLAGCNHLADLSSHLLYEDARPTVLVGQDNWPLVVPRELRAGRKNQPVASRTNLGWVLHGYRPAAAISCFTTCHVRSAPDDDLHHLVRVNFDLEALGVTARNPRVPTEERALDILARTSRKTTDGRYEVGLLWKEDNPVMPPSESQALNRLRSVERKMKKDSEFELQYRKHMNALFDSGYAELCLQYSSSEPAWYLPHFAVQNPRKPGKIRIVFDAAARVNNTSLNDRLIPGPDLLQSLLGVLLRFREGAVAVTGDIKEMFLRIIIQEKDRDAQRFLWRDHPDEPPRHYRMRSLIFGATSSPCTALYVKNKNARAETNDEKIITAIERDHYVDDAIISADNEESATYITDTVTAVHAAGGFEIRGWASNRPAALKNIDSSARGSGIVDLASSGATYERTLGLIWNTKNDELAFDLSLHRVPQDVATGLLKPTKRQMLSLVMSVYDPLGLLSPVMTRAKVLLQLVWRSAIGWDDELKEDLHPSWTNWLQTLQMLRNLRLPRHYGGRINSVAELHIFCDASTEAYAAVAYWLVEDAEKMNLRSVLVASKSRVSPLRPVSIPRLELQAALLGVRLAGTISKEHRMQPSSITYWSDSRTALTWIRAEARRYKPFVAHRVAEIQECTRPEQWRWVPSSMNAADLATRSPPTDFSTSHWWFTGPAFLTQPRGGWPSEEAITTPTTPLIPEEEVEYRTTYVARTPTLNDALPKLERFSSWTRLIRSTGRVLQFVEVLRTRLEKTTAIVRKKGRRRPANVILPPRPQGRKYIELPQSYLRSAEILWTKQSQELSFHEEIRQIRAGESINNNSRLITLAPRIDSNGVLRPVGRIGAVKDVAVELREPIILDGREAYVQLLITHYHHTYRHANHETVVNEIRQRYWVLRLRGALRSIAHACLWCKVHKGIPNIPPPGDLPSARLRHHERPFTAVGLDYFGPMDVTIGRRREKRWGALFTCLTTRAVHMELATTLSADSMLLALRRMIARRGTPIEIYSDNGTNFIGARRELEEARVELEAVGQAAAQLSITWRTIPPGAPRMGGAWERLVRSVKTALAATLRERMPKEEVLLTLLLEAEHIVNCRPLTHVSAHPQDDEALTPNHFLIGASSGAPSPTLTSDRDLAVLSSIKHNEKGYVYTFLRPWLQQGLLLSDGPKWHARRKILTPAFHFNILRHFSHILEENSWRLVRRLQAEAGRPRTDLVPVISAYTLHSICETAMGTSLQDQSPEKSRQYERAIHELGVSFVKRLTCFWLHPSWLFNLSGVGARQRQTLDEVRSFPRRVIEERRQRRECGEEVCIEGAAEDPDLRLRSTGAARKRMAMLDLLLTAERDGLIDSAGIQEEVDTFMFEGHDTTTSGLCYTLLLLANYKSIQENVVAELDGIFGDSQRAASMADLAGMKYLEACIKESLRLYPPVPFIARRLGEELHLKDYIVPAGTQCHINIFDLHRRADLFPDPLQFRPERFLSEGAEGRHPFAYIPFSAGSRNCIGQKFAMLELKSAVCALLRRYRLLPVTAPADLVFISDLVLRVGHPIYVQFENRI